MNDTRIMQSPLKAERDARPDPVRFGLIALATDLTSESDFIRMLPEGARLHTTRVAYENPTTPENLMKMTPRITEAAGLLVPGVKLGAICYSCTAASATIGEEPVTQAVAASQPEVPVVTPTRAAAWAFAALGARRIAVLTPYLPETSAPVAAYFEARGHEITELHCFGLEDDRDMARIARSSIIAGAKAVDSAEAEAIFISCTALPALDAIAEIEALTGKPVVTSNQASIWATLRLGGFADYRPQGYGRLFDLPLPTLSGDRAA